MLSLLSKRFKKKKEGQQLSFLKPSCQEFNCCYSSIFDGFLSKTVSVSWSYELSKSVRAGSALRVRLLPSEAKLSPPAGPILAQGLGSAASDFIIIFNQITSSLSVGDAVSFYPKDFPLSVFIKKQITEEFLIFPKLPSYFKLFECFDFQALVKGWLDCFFRLTRLEKNSEAYHSCYLRFLNIEIRFNQMFLVYLSLCGIFVSEIFLKNSALGIGGVTTKPCLVQDVNSLNRSDFYSLFVVLEPSVSFSYIEDFYFMYVELLRAFKLFYNAIVSVFDKNLYLFFMQSQASDLNNVGNFAVPVVRLRFLELMDSSYLKNLENLK